jgi:hypothetical protein
VPGIRSSASRADIPALLFRALGPAAVALGVPVHVAAAWPGIRIGGALLLLVSAHATDSAARDAA